jgi:hypothetical protein
MMLFSFVIRGLDPRILLGTLTEVEDGRVRPGHDERRVKTVGQAFAGKGAWLAIFVSLG